MSYEVIKVANGYMVNPGRSWMRDGTVMHSDVHVFPTWTEASKWLRDAFEVANSNG